MGTLSFSGQRSAQVCFPFIHAIRLNMRSRFGSLQIKKRAIPTRNDTIFSFNWAPAESCPDGPIRKKSGSCIWSQKARWRVVQIWVESESQEEQEKNKNKNDRHATISDDFLCFPFAILVNNETWPDGELRWSKESLISSFSVSRSHDGFTSRQCQLL